MTDLKFKRPVGGPAAATPSSRVLMIVRPIVCPYPIRLRGLLILRYISDCMNINILGSTLVTCLGFTSQGRAESVTRRRESLPVSPASQ